MKLLSNDELIQNGLITPEESELYHHGILGMKWGVRRYQNKDGTLTAAGKKRYGTVENLTKDVERKKQQRELFKNEMIRGAKIASKVALASIGIKFLAGFSMGVVKGLEIVNSNPQYLGMNIENIGGATVFSPIFE